MLCESEAISTNSASRFNVNQLPSLIEITMTPTKLIKVPNQATHGRRSFKKVRAIIAVQMGAVLIRRLEAPAETVFCPVLSVRL